MLRCTPALKRSAVRVGLLGLALLGGCAGNGPLDAELAATAQAERARQPAFYENGNARAFLVRRDGRPVGLLWGTIHIAYGADTQMPFAIRQRFYGAADLTVEVVVDRLPQAKMQDLRKTLRAANETADADALARLDPPTREALRQAVPPGSTGHLSLRGLANLVAAQAAVEPSQALPVVGFVDVNLIGFARSQGLVVRGLEPPQLPDPTIAQPNGEDAAGTLRLNLRRADGMREMGRWTRSAYAAGDVADTVAVLGAWRATSADLRRSDRVRQDLFTRRNQAWIPRLERIFARPGFHFVAFGAGHLPGSDGVVALLRAQGFEVLPCQGDICPG